MTVSPAPILERPSGPPASPARVLADFDATCGTNGLIGFVFAASGPLAVILSAGQQGGLTSAQIASWLFGAFFVNGVLTVVLSCVYRTPLVFFWTIPGTVLVGPTLAAAPHAEVFGAYLVTGVLMAGLGLSGWVRRGLAAVPMPIVMGMVAGVFLRFGLDLVRAVHQDLAIAGPMVVAFMALSAWPRAARLLPPMIGALLVGAAAVALSGRDAWPADAGLAIVPPVMQMPAWSLPVLLELVLPLAITVLVVQNGQGIAVLKAAGHAPPVNIITLACGLVSTAIAFIGAVPTCLTGPTNALVASSGERSRHYAGAVFIGLLAIAFGLLSAGVAAVMLGLPKAFIAALAGLAMLRVLRGAFSTAFGEPSAIGPLASFLVTVADLPIAGIGAPFWGLAVGFAVSRALDRHPVTDGRPEVGGPR